MDFAPENTSYEWSLITETYIANPKHLSLFDLPESHSSIHPSRKLLPLQLFKEDSHQQSVKVLSFDLYT